MRKQRVELLDTEGDTHTHTHPLSLALALQVTLSFAGITPSMTWPTRGLVLHSPSSLLDRPDPQLVWIIVLMPADRNVRI